MFHARLLHGVAVTCAAATVWLAAPVEGRGCCDWLLGGWGAQTTYRTPYVAQSCAPAGCASACTTCVPQTASYVPQTCYRTVYQRVPVTTCGALTCSDPCTGCPVTYYRPVTTWTYRAAYVPYTTYRIVYSNPCSPCASYGACSSCTTNGACSSCTTNGACSTNVGTTFGTGGACCTPGTTAVPQGASSSGAGEVPNGDAAPETFKNSETEVPDQTPAATPDPNTSSNPGPNLSDPANRTTFRPASPPVRYHLIGSPSTSVRPPIDDGGWQPAGK